MADEDKKIDIEEEVEEVIDEESKEVTLSPEEQAELDEAIDAGYNPDGVDKDGNHLSPKEYMARKPLFNKIHKLSDKNAEMEQRLSAIQGDLKKITQAAMKEKESLLAQLKEKRDKALDNLDVDEVRSIEKQIDTVKEVSQQEVRQASYNEKDWSKAYIGFIKENKWYDQNPGLKSAADIIGKEYAESHPDASPDSLYSHVVSEIKREFADRFEEKPTPKTSRVGSTNTRRSGNAGKKGMTLADLPEDERKIAQQVMSYANLSEEDYFKTYK